MSSTAGAAGQGTVRRFIGALMSASPGTTVASALVMLLLSVIEGVGILLLVPLLGLVGVDAGQGSLGGIVRAFSAAFAAIGVRPTLPIVLAVYVGLAAVQSMLQRWQASLNLTLQQEFMTALRGRVYRAISGARWAFLAKSRSSDAMHVLTQLVDRVGTTAYSLITLVVTAVVALVYVLMALRVSPGMTLLVLFCGGVLAVGARRKLKSARASGEAMSASSRRVYAAITEHLTSLKTARSYGVTDRHAEIFGALIQEQRDVQARAMAQAAGLRQRLALGVPIILAAVVYVSYGVLQLPTASLFVLLFLFARLMPRITGLFENAQTFLTALPAFAALSDFEARCLAEAEPASTGREPLVLRRRIELEQVSFSYDTGADFALRGVTLAIDAGATTAIVGPSGAGKSTLADLLLGLLSPDAGRVAVDGTPIDAAHVDAWRAQIGYVPQDTFLFHDSVRANLLWAQPNATDDDLWRALRLAAADAFVAALPQGLDTRLGDRGVLLSGGERQRISLARALLRQPNVLIMDEATSSLDSENEQRIQQAIDGLHEQITIIVITHRLSTIRNADVVHVVDKGRLVESGTWDTLVARPQGRFRELCAAQGIETLTKTRPPAGLAAGTSQRPKGGRSREVVH